MAVTVKLDQENREAVIAGMNKLADAVKITLGPKGRNVVLDRAHAPLITNDGVTIAKEIEMEDRYENMGAQIIREVASATNDAAGDGTTTSTVLAQAMINEGIRNIAAGANAIVLRKGMKKAEYAAITAIRKMSHDVTTKKQIERVATISSGDPETGAMIADVMERVSADGVITIEESKTMQTELNVVEGMQFDRGFISVHMADNQEKLETVLEKPYIFIVNKKISSVQDILPVLEQLMQEKKSMLLIAEDVEGEALTTLIVNHMRGILNVVAVKAPGFGERRKEALEDIAIVTGGTIFESELGNKLSEASLGKLGSAEKVVVNKEQTIIVEGNGDKEAVRDRVSKLKHQLADKDKDSKYEAEKIRERIAKLAGGVAVISVGAETEVAMKELKLRVEDALNATRAAVEEGVVAGGGTTYLDVQGYVKKLMDTLSGDERTGADIVYRALEKPLMQIAKNAGLDAAVVVSKVREAEKGMGFNAETNEYCDMYEAGILDPVKVTRSALENAVSIASSALTAQAGVGQIPEKRPPMPDMSGVGGMGGMM